MALILGIETSCDETAAAVVEDGRKILSNVVASQIDIHAPYGGVFPEIASREHVLKIVPVIEDTLKGAGVTFRDLAAIAVTHGPGLAGALLVGVNTAKALAFAILDFTVPYVSRTRYGSLHVASLIIVICSHFLSIPDVLLCRICSMPDVFYSRQLL